MRDQTIAVNCRSTTSQYDLKLDRGGLVDIEFLVQYWVLNWARDYPQLVVDRDNYSIIKALLDVGLIDADTGSSLLEILTLHLTTENRLKLQEMPPLIDQNQLAAERNRITSLWQQHLSAD
jgi:glutamate-ammonia-ligase adenylyltransferase